MTKICIAIGEGISERYFLPALLESVFGFEDSAQKGNFVYSKGDTIFWFIPFPPLVTIPEGGKARLRKTNTYKECNAIIHTHKHLFSGNVPPEIHYYVLNDSDGHTGEELANRIAEIDGAIESANVKKHKHKIIIVEREIETWYLSGLTSENPILDDGKKKRIDEILQMNPEAIEDPKRVLKEIIHPDFHDETMRTAQVMGKHFNIDKGISKSASFSGFIASLRENGLI